MSSNGQSALLKTAQKISGSPRCDTDFKQDTEYENKANTSEKRMNIKAAQIADLSNEPNTAKSYLQSMNFQNAMKAAENPKNSSKNNSKFKGQLSVKNNLDVQNVRDAILGSVDCAHSEYSQKQKKMRFLNSLDESKDLEMVRRSRKKAVIESDHHQDLIQKCKDVAKLLEVSKLEHKRSSVSKDTCPITRYANASKRQGVKNEAVQKVEVFLATQENMENNQSSRIEIDNLNIASETPISEHNENFRRKKSNTEALRPLIIKPKEHAALFKTKVVNNRVSRGI